MLSVSTYTTSIFDSEIVTAAPGASMRKYVSAYLGVRESGAPVLRRWLPVPSVTVILAFDGWNLTVDGHAVGDRTGLVRGLSLLPLTVQRHGSVHGIMFALTPLGASAILGPSCRELHDQIIPLESVLGKEARIIAARLSEMSSWARRFEALEEWLKEKASARAPVSPEVSWAWQRLFATGGRLPINVLFDELGCSPRHLTYRFGEATGMTPKAYGRVVRFERAMACLVRGDSRLGDIAQECGYYDQAHFNRDARALAGTRPGVLLKERIGDNLTFGTIIGIG